MSFISVGGGITKLSQLIIDADKDWQTKGITNLKQVAALMSKGDIIVRGDNILERVQTGPNGYVYTSAGVGKKPVWAPAGGSLNYYLPVIVSSSVAEAIVAVARSISKNSPVTTDNKASYIDDPADNIRRITPTIVSTDAEAIITIDHAIPKTSIVKSGLSILCDGFVEETALGVQTDHTAEARNGTANDLNLNPMTDTVLDKIYIGSNYPFWQAQMQVGINGSGNWTNVWYYWNGSIWTPVVNELDGGSNWFNTPAGLKLISHTPQMDWALKTIMGMNLYWLMDQTDNFVNRTTKPLGSQVWVAIA